MKFSGVYWFYLEHYVYLKVTDKQVLLLNTLDSEKIISENPLIIALMRKMNHEQFNGGLEIDFSNKYADVIYHSFFLEVRNLFMGDLISKNAYKIPPFQYPISWKINSDFRKENKRPQFDFVLNSVLAINLHLNSKCNNNCPDCNKYYKQVNCCAKFTGNKSLSIDYISEILNKREFNNLNKINLLGGDLSLYNDWDELFKLLIEYRDKCFVFYNYLNIKSITNEIRAFFCNRINIMVDLDLIDDSCFNLLTQYQNCSIFFLLRSDIDYKRVVDKKLEFDYTLIPFYNEKNLQFFQENVLLDEDDILSMKHTIRQIHRNQVLNYFFWGELTVFPNGDVCSNVNRPILGNIQNESIDEMIVEILTDSDSLWFFTRNKTACKNCLFVDLCPPISNYELSANKFDLCNLIKYKQ